MVQNILDDTYIQNILDGLHSAQETKRIIRIEHLRTRTKIGRGVSGRNLVLESPLGSPTFWGSHCQVEPLPHL